MCCAYTRPRYQVSVYMTIGPLVLGLSTVLNRYPKGSHTTWATERSITA